MSTRSQSASLEQRTAAFRRRFTLLAAGSISATSLLIAIITLVVDLPFYGLQITIAAFGLAMLCGGTFYLAWRNKLTIAAYLLVFGNYIGVGLAIDAFQAPVAEVAYAFAALTIISAFVLKPSSTLILGALGVVFFSAAHIQMLVDGALDDDLAFRSSSALIHIIVASVLTFLFSKEAHANLEALKDRVSRNDSFFRDVLSASNRLSSAARGIFSRIKEQTQASFRQSSAIEETQSALSSLTSTFNETYAFAQETLKNAETTLVNSEHVAEDIQTLSNHTERILAVLEAIKDFANKSDLLALNAALEGTRAGEKGRGFSLVASEMQQLAENVAGSATEILELTNVINQATNATRLSVDGTMRLARTTTDVAQKINLITNQQRTAVEQVSTAMIDIREMTSLVVGGANETIPETEALTALAQELVELVKGFETDAVELQPSPVP